MTSHVRAILERIGIGIVVVVVDVVVVVMDPMRPFPAKRIINFHT